MWNLLFTESYATAASLDMGMAGLPFYQHALSEAFLPKLQQDINLSVTPLEPLLDLEFSHFMGRYWMLSGAL